MSAQHATETVERKRCISCGEGVNKNGSFVDNDGWQIHYRCALGELMRSCGDLLMSTDFQVETCGHLDSTTIVAARNLQDRMIELGGGLYSHLWREDAQRQPNV